MASACSSGMSVSKSGASVTDTNTSGNRKPAEAGCSKKTSCVLQRKKPVNPLSVPIRPPKVDAVRQRVRSARMLKIRTLQSQLNDANYHLMELAQENRALKSTQRRQDKALNNYEGTNADLPRLIQSHGEENRILQERNRTLKRQLREVTDTLKARDDEMLAVKDQLKQLSLLAKDKHLEERAQLSNALNEAKELIKNYESEISMLNRKLALEVKNCRHKMNAEAYKYKKCKEELDNLIQTNSGRLGARILGKRFDHSPSTDRKSCSNLSATSKETIDSDLKLEPIKKRNNAESRNSLTSPVEKIKARLSNSEARPTKIEDFNDVLEKLSLEEEHIKKSLQAGIKTTKVKTTKLETLVQTRKAMQTAEKEEDALMPPPIKPRTKRFEDMQKFKKSEDGNSSIDDSPRFRTHPVGSVTSSIDLNQREHEEKGSCSSSDAEDVVSNHRKTLHKSEVEFKCAQREISEIEQLENVIEKNREAIVLKPDDHDLVDDVWNKEFSFNTQRSRSQRNSLESGDKVMLTFGNYDNYVENDVNSHKKEKEKEKPAVALENKRKLLAALRDIDNGNSLEQQEATREIVQNNNIEIDSRKSRLMKELFG